MKKKLLFIFSLFISFTIFCSPRFALAQGTYELYNDLSYPITVDVYRTYWEKDQSTTFVLIETIKLNPKKPHKCDFTQTNDADIRSYQYRIQFETNYYIKDINQVHGNLHTDVSSIIKRENKLFGWYRIPPLNNSFFK